MTVGSGLTNAELTRKRIVELAQEIHARYVPVVTELRTALLDYPYPEPVLEPREVRVTVTAVRGTGELVLVTATAPDGAAPADGVGIWEFSVTGTTPLARGEAEGWARALFGYRCAPLVYRHSAGSGWFRRPSSEHFTVFHGEHGPMHPTDVPARRAHA